MPWLSQLFFVCIMVSVSVVALNALIALLGDSFEKVQDSKQSKENQLRARLIVEYLSTLAPKARLAVELKTCWAHQLMPASEHERRSDGDGEWGGRLKAIHDMVNKSSKEMSTKSINHCNREGFFPRKRLFPCTALLDNLAKHWQKLWSLAGKGGRVDVGARFSCQHSDGVTGCCDIALKGCRAQSRKVKAVVTSCHGCWVRRQKRWKGPNIN